MTAPFDAFKLPPRRRAERLSVAVVTELVELIVTGRLAEGTLLPPEGPLSEHFGVSRTVIREAAKRLEETVCSSSVRAGAPRSPGPARGTCSTRQPSAARPRS